jgi:hypothetical protein
MIIDYYKKYLKYKIKYINLQEELYGGTPPGGKIKKKKTGTKPSTPHGKGNFDKKKAKKREGQAKGIKDKDLKNKKDKARKENKNVDDKKAKKKADEKAAKEKAAKEKADKEKADKKKGDDNGGGGEGEGEAVPIDSPKNNKDCHNKCGLNYPLRLPLGKYKECHNNCDVEFPKPNNKKKTEKTTEEIDVNEDTEKATDMGMCVSRCTKGDNTCLQGCIKTPT